MIYLYNIIFYQPIFNLLVWLYNTIPGHDIGIAIIILTVIIRLILYPLSIQSIKSQKALSELQPKIDELKRKYKDDQQKMAQEMMTLYKNEKVNPASSCLPLLIQFPFLIAVYQVFRSGLASNGMEMLYPFVANPGTINHISLGFLNLAAASWPLAVLAGLAQFVQTKMMVSRKQPPIKTDKPMEGSKDEAMLAIMNKQMVYIAPIMTVIIGISLPAGLTLYWFLSTLLLALQQLIIFKEKDKNVNQLQKIN